MKELGPDAQLSAENAAELARTVEQEHKRMSTRVVIPALGTMNVLMLMAYWSNEPIKLSVIVHALVMGTAFNIWMTAKERTFKVFGREFKSRDDAVDLARWTYNLLITDALELYFVVGDPMGHLATWIILGLSAQMDTFRRGSRTATLVMAFLMGYVPFVLLYGKTLPVMTLIYAAASYISTSLIFLTFERTWVSSLTKAKSAAQREAFAVTMAEKMKAEALIGFQQRTIAHEMANLTMIIDLYSRQLPEDGGAAIKRAVVKIKSLNHLVLDKYHDSTKKKRVVVAEFVADVNLLLKRLVEARMIAFSAVIDGADTGQTVFDEFDGATYFIVQNLIKNAMDAVAQKHPLGEEPGEVKLTISKSPSAGKLRFRIEDSGIGMDTAQLGRLVAGEAPSGKVGGHGLGNRLVRHECQRNGFSLDATSEPGRGTAIWFDVVTADPNTAPGDLTTTEAHPAA